MEHNNIEIQIIHTKAMEQDNGFGIRIIIDGEDKSVLELDKSDILHIEGILLNVIRKFINNFKLNNDYRK